MAGYTTAARNTAADAVAARVTALSLHSADPGTTGASELVGGSYARKTPAYVAAAAGSADISASLVFDVPASSTVAYYGQWDGLTFLGGHALSASETYTGAGTYTLTSAAVTAA